VAVLILRSTVSKKKNDGGKFQLFLIFLDSFWVIIGGGDEK